MVESKEAVFYSLKDIEEEAPDAKYYVIFGERSNGKTTAVMERILKNWIDKGEQGAYLRRYDDDLIQGAAQVYESIANERGLVTEWTKGEWTGVTYYRKKFYLSRYDEDKNKVVKQNEPFCYAFPLNLMERFKGGSYSGVTTICYDEFMTRDRELTGEFESFRNTISTIIRHRTGAKIYLLGNTVNKVSTYFSNMGIKPAMRMKPGSLSTFKDKDDKIHIAVEYCSFKEDNDGEGKASDSYFIFGNNKADMITEGAWEIPNYPRLPKKYNNWDILESFFIDYNDEVYKGDIVYIDEDELLFIYIHTDFDKLFDDESLIYNLEFSARINRSVGLIRGPYKTELGGRIADMFKKDQVFYEDNDIGDMVRNYILTSDKLNSTNLH